MNRRIWLSPPHMGKEELSFINEAFASNWITSAGPNIEAFERELCEYTGARYCVLTSSGTAAIHLALLALGVSSGDEVLCSAFTFAATANPIAYCGATPVFIESEPSAWNMSPDFLEEAIRQRLAAGRKPKAIIAVHLYGMPAKMDELMDIAARYEIPLIEDAAEALGASYKGIKAGTLADTGIYSFNGNKIITTSGGGALVTRDKRVAEHALYLSTQAREKVVHYEHKAIGYNA